MGSSSALIISAILMMATFVATDTTTSPVKQDIDCTCLNPFTTVTTTYVSLTPSPCLIRTRTIQRTVTQLQYRPTTIIEYNTRPSLCYTSDEIRPTATVTQSIESCRVACTNSSIKQANIVAGVVGGFVGGSVFGIVLAVLVIAAAAILITKRHKNRYIYITFNMFACV